MNINTKRVEADVHRHLTDILREVRDPRVDKLATIVRVELSADMSYCKVYVSSLGGFESSKKTAEGLKSAKGYIRRELFSRLDARKCPELNFIADNSAEETRIMLEKIEKANKKIAKSEEDNNSN